jgi:hypothetical protein
MEQYPSRKTKTRLLKNLLAFYISHTLLSPPSKEDETQKCHGLMNCKGIVHNGTIVATIIVITICRSGVITKPTLCWYH